MLYGDFLSRSGPGDRSSIPDRIYMEAPGLTREEAMRIAERAVFHARRLAPKLSGESARRFQPVAMENWFGVAWLDAHVWFQEVGIRPFTMKHLEGKAQPDTELVLTPSGWRKMGDLEAGDLVVGSSGAPTEVMGVYPQGERDCLRIEFSDRTTVRCSPDHLWGVYYRCGGSEDYRQRLHVREASDLVGSPSGAWWVPNPGPIKFQTDFDPPVDPYLLGVLLSEGCRGTSPIFSQKPMPVVEEIERSLTDGLTVKRSNERSWRIVAGVRGTNHNPLAAALRELGLATSVSNETDLRECPTCGITGTKRGPFESSRSVLIHHKKAHGTSITSPRERQYGLYSFEKFIPEPYLTASVSARTALLQGLMDGDGSCPATGRKIRYHTSSPRLAEDVMELVRSLGGLVYITTEGVKPPRQWEGRTVCSRHPMYTVVMQMAPGVIPFRARLDKKLLRYLSRQSERELRPWAKKIVAIEPDGVEPMRCIEVAADDGLYVTSGYTVTHNTIPMWIDDADGELRKKDPKADTRTTADGRTQVLIFRRAAKRGQRKVELRRRGGEWVKADVPASFPGAPGRIAFRKPTGQIAAGNIGVRWRHPGMDPKGFLYEGMVLAAVEVGLQVREVIATNERWL